MYVQKDTSENIYNVGDENKYYRYPDFRRLSAVLFTGFVGQIYIFTGIWKSAASDHNFDAKLIGKFQSYFSTAWKSYQIFNQ